jgi:predicted metalloprotease
MANWEKILSRGNVEDRRSYAPAAIGGISLAGAAVVFLFTYLSGGSFSDALNQLGSSALQAPQTTNIKEYQGADDYEVFASTVLGSNNDMWSAKFEEIQRTYASPKLVLFRTATASSCGGASSDVGPHYCPIDQTIYLDETFFDELTSRFGAQGGDVAQAYVIAHEAGHHAQNALGIMDKVQSTVGYSQEGANGLSVKLELQADCFAGMWANSIKGQGVLEPGEIREAIDAAAAVGDDRIQKTVTGYIHPESWTHGSSAQRVAWFNKGYESGLLSDCNTF